MPGRRLPRRWLLATLALLGGLWPLVARPGPAWAAPPPGLRHGINLTGWFRFPVSTDPARLAAYMSDAALSDLRRAGFDFVRLAVEPELVRAPGIPAALVEAIRRIQRQDLRVVVALHPQHWRLETSAADRAALRAAWRDLSATLRALPAAQTLPEILNEPVFSGDGEGWAALQHEVLGLIRGNLPDATVVLTGADWGSIAGLLALTPEADANTLYSFHVYEPQELTSLAAWRQDIDHAALRALPFPARPPCLPGAGGATADLAAFYCASGWDAGKVAASVARAATWAQAHHVRLLAGEFGASAALNPPARLAWLAAERAAFEAHGIAWALWGYDDVMGFNVARPPPARPCLDPGVLGALGLHTAM